MTIQKAYNSLTNLVRRIIKMVQRFSIALGTVFVPVGFAMITASYVNGIIDSLLIRILGAVIGLLGFTAFAIAYHEATETDKRTRNNENNDKITPLIANIDLLINEIKKGRKTSNNPKHRH